jgi:hypothetical protein
MITTLSWTMEATIMLAITELGARATKLTISIYITIPMIPIHIAVATNPNAELLCTSVQKISKRY